MVYSLPEITLKNVCYTYNLGRGLALLNSYISVVFFIQIGISFDCGLREGDRYCSKIASTAAKMYQVEERLEFTNWRYMLIPVP